MTAYSVLEYRSLPHGDGRGYIQPHHASRLAAIAQRSAFAGRRPAGVLEDRRHDLRARGVVGVLAATDCSLEILPKIEVPAPDGSPEAQGQIRQRLVHLLAVVLDLKIETGAMTALDWQRETLLEILIRIFCDKLTEAVRRGMPRRYVPQEDDLPALRGALDLPRQFTRHTVNPSRLACRFDELSPDIALNQIMKAVLSHLSRMSRSPSNLQKLRELDFVYAEITPVPRQALRWGDVIIDRTNRAWKDLLSMARLFLFDRYQTTTLGKGQGTALLFEMNVLFEEYIGRLMIRALAGTDFSVSLQGGRKYCLTSIEDKRGLFQTKPDILIWLGDRIVHVIDTKWKTMSPRIEDPKQGVSQADIYQMMAYAHLYKAPKLTLLYPHHNGLESTDGTQAEFTITEQTTLLRIASINIATANDAEVISRLKGLVLGSPMTELAASM